MGDIRLESYFKLAICEENSLNITPLLLGTKIGEESQWRKAVTYYDQFYLTAPGYTEWFGDTAYVGFGYEVDTLQRYGWLRMSVSEDGESCILHDYAYNTKPFDPIYAGFIDNDDFDDDDDDEFEDNDVYDEPDNDLEIKLSISPNPVHDNCKVKLKSSEVGEIQLKIINSLGNIELNKSLMKSAIVFQYDISISDLSSGIYYLQVLIGDEIISEKFMVD